MKTVINYLVSRMISLPAWIGVIGFILEIVLHVGNFSTLMLVLFTILVVAPEDKVRELFDNWAQKVKASLS